MVLTADELAPAKELLHMEGRVREDTFIVGLVRPRSPLKQPRRAPPVFPQKALMNLVSDICTSRYEWIFAQKVLVTSQRVRIG